MGPHDTQAGDMAVLNSINWLLLHLCEHIAYNSWIVIGTFLGPRDIYGHEGELGPGKGVIQIVFHKVVFGEIGDVSMLDVRNIRRAHKSDIHDCD
jgi:hypothetical protein